MAAIDVAVNVHDHGMALDPQKIRVQCNYCEKIVSGFSRLKQHLGGIRGNVSPCEEVPQNVKDLFSTELLEKKREYLSKEVGALDHPDLPWKRNWGSHSNGINEAQPGMIQPAASGSKKHARANSIPRKRVLEVGSCSERSLFPQTDANATEGLASKQAKKCIGRFFCETGIDFSVSKSPSFQRMLNALIGFDQLGLKIPSCQDFKGWILEDEVKEMQQYVKEIRKSWVSTGCSILLDGWVDEKGRNLLHILVDCPRGPIYLRSLDISAAIGNVDALVLILDEVIEEVGSDNVIQVITYSVSACMREVGKRLEVRHGKLFWTVSASHCFGLMLENLWSIRLVKDVMEKAKSMIKFIYSRASVLKLMKICIDGRDLVSSSKIRSAMPFLTLENIVSERENLKEMFASSRWSNSFWGSRIEGRRIADLVVDGNFWMAAIATVKASIPLVRAIYLINESNEPQLGFIYETMDQVKETIRKEFKKRKAQYMPFWRAIDEIWNNYLYSPLHSAAYYLNPRFFYTEDFFTDAEVVGGLFCCICKFVPSKELQDVVTAQVFEYEHARGNFDRGSEPRRRLNMSPALWWVHYGGGCPNLQEIAIRILSQPCDGVVKYGLKRGLAESLLTEGRNPMEQQRLNDLAFVHYNLQLRNSAAGPVNLAEEIDPMDDWVVDETLESDLLNSEPTWMELNGEGSSGHPKDENV